jgi:CelD/BcsL family acetyltransferase involved in cellulose biosynthesis
MNIQIIRNWEKLSTLDKDWNCLLQESNADTVFLTWEWISAWRDAVASNSPLMTIVIRDDGGRLIAIAPFYVGSLRLLKVLAFRCLRLLGDYLCGAEYPNVIIRKGSEDVTVPLIAEVLRENRTEWDCIWAPNLASWRHSDQSFMGIALNGGFHYRKCPCDFSAIAIPGDYESYEKCLSKNARHDLRRTTKKVVRDFGGEMVLCRNKEELGAMLPELFRLNRERWLSAGVHAGTFRYPQRKVFYQQLSETMLSKDRLGFYGLRVHGQFRALFYGYIYRDTYIAMSLGYDTEFESQHHTSAANVLFGLIIKDLICKGIREFDYLGGKNDYKFRWGAQPREGSHILLCNSTLKGKVLNRSRMWPTGRYIQQIPPSN